MLWTRDPLADPEPLIARVYAYVAYRIGEGPEAEDVTSEVFERALRFRKSYNPSRGQPVSWLIGIARRVIADRRAPELLAEQPEVAAPGNIEEEAVQRLTLAEAVASLDPREQELIALRYGADLTARQIARVVGSRTNTVEVALHRALARLRARLSGTPEPEAIDGALRTVRI